MQGIGEPVAAALLTRMNSMSKIHIASLVVSLVFGMEGLDGYQKHSGNGQHKQHTDNTELHTRFQENTISADGSAGSQEQVMNVPVLAEVVKQMICALHQMGLLDRTLPCSLAHVLLNSAVTSAQQSAAVLLLCALQNNEGAVASVAVTLSHAPKDSLEHLQPSTVAALERMCSGVSSGMIYIDSMLILDEVWSGTQMKIAGYGMISNGMEVVAYIAAGKLSSAINPVCYASCKQ